MGQLILVWHYHCVNYCVGQLIWGSIVTLAVIAASERADAGVARRISLGGLSQDETETIRLLFEILGWQVAIVGANDRLARLHLFREEAVIRVATACPDRARVLAVNGLDRLVAPLNLAALEQLSVLAG
jgi:hypothetical protein